MSSMITRVLAVVVAVAVIQGAVLLIRQKREPAEVRLPEIDAQEMPRRLGAWTGVDAELDPRLSAAIGADVVVDRLYRRDSGDRILSEVAVFTKYEVGIGHLPQICYTKVGWTIMDQKDVELPLEDDVVYTAHLMAFEQEGQRIHVLYWFQLGDASLLDNEGLRRERWKLFGRKAWPPLIKVMLQSSLADGIKAEDQLRSLAQPLLVWSRKLR